ncbi:hypothetical protein GFV12_05260 [Desulfurobacterium thermolithotrophum]|uniref:hypothetical protein n=1 Tax=Desulfurobacterium thermolithotrophum TaxID=64160 RepID=UPI0013D05343|nr:hypothetical protein [Desulfurobacterium thermolithotrophum]
MARCAYKSILKDLEKLKGELLSGSPKALALLDGVIKSLKKRVNKESSSPAVRELLYYAYGKYQEETGNPMAANYARDGKILKEALKSIKPLAEAEQMEPEELFKILWDLFVNRYTKRRADGFPYFKTQLQKLYEWWKSEREAPIDFGESVATNPKFGVSKEFATKIELTESED